jgi:hypothetical protein
MYHGLTEVARRYGYTLAIHGSVATDLDLIAVPWIAEAAPEEDLVRALKDHIRACDFEEHLTKELGSAEAAKSTLAVHPKQVRDPELKPHGRLAWNLYLDFGAKVDLSVMPRVVPA